MEEVGLTVKEAFKRYKVAEHKQTHKCAKCEKVFPYTEIEFNFGCVIFKGKPHGCDKKYWGSRLKLITKQEKEYWVNIAKSM